MIKMAKKQRRGVFEWIGDSVHHFFFEYSTEGSFAHYLGVIGAFIGEGIHALEMALHEMSVKARGTDGEDV